MKWKWVVPTALIKEGEILFNPGINTWVKKTRASGTYKGDGTFTCVFKVHCN